MLSILKTNFKIAFFTGFSFFLFSSFGFAVQEKVLDIRARIKTQEKRVETFSRKEVDILDRLNEIDHTLNRARIKEQALLKAVIRLEGKISRLNQDRDQLLKKNMITRKYAGERIVALYKMNRIGRLVIAGQPPSAFDFFLQQNAMKRIIVSDFKILEKQSSAIAEFEALEQELKNEIQAKKKIDTELKNQIRANKKESHKKERLLKDIRQKKKCPWLWSNP